MQRLKSLLFENQTLQQTVLKNTFWLTFGNMASRLIRAVLIIYAARVLGVAGYGVFSYALSIAGFFSIFADVGITPLLTRESARNPEERIHYLSTGLFIKFFFMLVSTLLILFAAPLITKIEGAQELFGIIVFLFAFDTLRDFFFGFTRSIEKMELEAGTNIATNLAILILGGAALLFAPTSKMLTIGYTAGSGVGLVVLLLILKKYLRNVWRSFRSDLVKPIITQAWPFALAGLLGTIMLQTDMIMLGWFWGAEEVGFYSAAQKIILLLYLLPGFLAVSLFPSFSRLASTDKEKFRLILEKGISAAFLMAFPIAVGGIILAPQIINLIYGPAYLQSSTAFVILLFTLFFLSPGVFVGNAIFAYNRQKLFTSFVGLGTVSNVIFNFLLIPSYGIVGSALATIGSQLLANGFIWNMMKKINNFKTLINLPKTLVAVFVMATATFIFRVLGINVVLNIAFSAVIYFAVLKILKEPLLEYVNPFRLFRNVT